MTRRIDPTYHTVREYADSVAHVEARGARYLVTVMGRYTVQDTAATVAEAAALIPSLRITANA